MPDYTISKRTRTRRTRKWKRSLKSTTKESFLDIRASRVQHVNENREDLGWFVETPRLLSFTGFAQFQDCCTRLIIKWHTSVGAVTTTPKSMHEGFPLEEVGKTRMNEVNRNYGLRIAALKG